jgi:hypothetical protein
MADLSEVVKDSDLSIKFRYPKWELKDLILGVKFME